MYQINVNSYAIEEGDRISFVKSGGGELDILIGIVGTREGLEGSEMGPRVIEKDEYVELSIIPTVKV